MSTFRKLAAVTLAIAMTLAIVAPGAQAVAARDARPVAANDGPMPTILDLQHGIPSIRPKTA